MNALEQYSPLNSLIGLRQSTGDITGGYSRHLSAANLSSHQQQQQQQQQTVTSAPLAASSPASANLYRSSLLNKRL